jgi:hypothetical protein
VLSLDDLRVLAGSLPDDDLINLTATVLLLTEGGPLAEEFMAFAPGDGAARRAFIQATQAWSTAETMLTGLSVPAVVDLLRQAASSAPPEGGPAAEMQAVDAIPDQRRGSAPFS